MHHIKTLAASTAIVLCALARLPKTDITVAMQLEPPNLDPTGGAARAIDSVLYANVFEGLTGLTPTARSSGPCPKLGYFRGRLVYTFNLPPASPSMTAPRWMPKM